MGESNSQVDGVQTHDPETGIRYDPPRLMGETESEYNDRKARHESERRQRRLRRSGPILTAEEKARRVWDGIT